MVTHFFPPAGGGGGGGKLCDHSPPFTTGKGAWFTWCLYNDFSNLVLSDSVKTGKYKGRNTTRDVPRSEGYGEC